MKAEPLKVEEKAKPTDEERSLELQAQVKRAASERMKLAHEARKQREDLAKEREQLAKDKTELESWRKEREDRRRNPAKYLSADYGPDWYDKLSSVKLNGSPPVELIASELDERSKGWEQKLADLDAKWAKRWEERDAIDSQRTRESQAQEALSYIKGNAERYPLVHAFETAENINNVIEAHFNATCTKDDVTGENVPGELWTPEQAATEMEKFLAERFEKANAKKQAAKPPPVVPAVQRTPTPTRRTLSTDMSASSGSYTPAKDDRERMARAEAAWEAARAARN